MNNRLVDSCLHILRLILEKEMSINAVIKQTSSDRSHVEETIKILIRGKLVTKNKDPGHKQKRILRLTTSGEEFAEQMKYIDQFNFVYLEIMKIIKENFELHEDTHPDLLSGKLRVKGWARDEIPSYFRWAGGSKNFGIDTGYIFIVALCVQYISQLFKAGKNEIARAIATRIFTNTLNQRGSAIYSSEMPKILNDREFPIRQASVNDSIDHMALSTLNKPIIRYLMQYSSGPQGYISLNNRFIKDISKDAINCIHCIIEPPKKGESDLKRDPESSQIPELKFYW
jgi:DNA-binding MarR family transcriptional regulator